MGVDLRLLPFDTAQSSLTVLNLNRDYTMQALISALPSQPVEGWFGSWCSDKDHWGATTKDAYGDPLRYVLAQDLLTVGWRLEPLAVRAYIEALNPDTRIVLYWH